MFLQSGFLFAVTAINLTFPCSQNHCKMTQPTDPTNSTEALLQELLKTVSTLKNDVSELKRADNDKGNSRKWPRNSEASGSQLVSRDGSLPYEYEGSDDNPISDAEDNKSSEAMDRFKLSEEGETSLETVFSSKMEYAMRKAKLAKYRHPDSRWTRYPELGLVVEGVLSNEALKQDKVSYRSQ